MSLDRWLLGAAFTIITILAGAWGSAIHSQLAEIKGALNAIASAQAGFATEMAVLKVRIDRLEQGVRNR